MKIDQLIKENPGITISVNASDLLQFGETIAHQAAQSILQNHEEKIYSRNEVIEKFQVCSATLWRWDKMGLINGQKIGNRKYYSETEIKRLTGHKRN